MNPEATPVVTPQSSLQPEMEAIPAVDVPVSETSLNTPSLKPHQPLGTEMEPFDLDSDTSVHKLRRASAFVFTVGPTGFQRFVRLFRFPTWRT